MSRFAKFATGLREFGNDINANISKALNIPKVSEDPNGILLEEARAGRVDGLKACLDDFASRTDVNGALDRSFLSPLCLACRGGHEEAALFLLHRANADPNNATGANEAAAAAAAAAAAGQRYGQTTDDDFTGSGGGGAGGAPPPTPLALAVGTSLKRVVEELLARGARVDTPRPEDGWTALHQCAARGDALMMEVLLRAPLADAGARTSRLETALSVASSRGHLSVVDMLLGGDEETAGGGGGGGGGVTGGEPAGKTTASGPPSVSAATGATGNRGARRHAEDKTWAGRTPLHRAASAGHTEVVLRLLAHGVAVDPTDSRRATPLHLAARGGHWGAARALIREGKASVAAATDEGDTVLHAAAGSGTPSCGGGGTAGRVVKLILKSGADVDARNRLGSTALHLAAAAADLDSVALLLSAGANPSVVNSCGLCPGAGFLRPPDGGAATATATTDATSSERVKDVRWIIREHRERFGHVRRLADASAKRVAVEAVADGATASVHRFVDFALKVQRWDLDARNHRTRLRRLDKFRSDILSDPPKQRTAADGNDVGNSLLLDLSPERESRAARAVKGRTKAAEEATKGGKLALRDLEDWRGRISAERAAVEQFLRGADPTLALVPGASCDAADGEGLGGWDAGGMDRPGGRAACEVDVVIADPGFLAAEADGGAGKDSGGRSRRHASWTGTGAEAIAPSRSTVGAAGPSFAEGDAPRRGGSADGSGGGGGRHRSRAQQPAVGFLRALAALDPCVSALREARSAAKTGDRLGMALETLREHVKVTLIDLMDLETSIPGEAPDSDDEAGDGRGGAAGPAVELSAADASSLDTKVAGLVSRLSGGGDADGEGDDYSGGGGGGGGGGGPRGPPSLASMYKDGLRGAAAASEAEVDATESLTARALGMVITAAAGPLLWALDDAYQRVTRAHLELRRLLPDAEALLGGAGSAEEVAREARSRLVSVRQQVVDEEDLLKELECKLGRRRRQAADAEEIRSIDDERLHARARLAALRSAKLAELKALRRSGAYRRFPELLLEHPDPAERAFRSLLPSGVELRDVDEWEDHHLASVASSAGAAGPGRASSEVGERVLAGLGGVGCRLAEIDGSAVAIVEVDCHDRQAERDLVADILSFIPRARPFPPEVAAVSGVSLQEGKALLEVNVEGALTSKAWLAASATAEKVDGKPVDRPGTEAEPAAVAMAAAAAAVDRAEDAPAPEVAAVAVDSASSERFQVEVWAVMIQALAGLAAVHAVSERSVHRAVCLDNILVAARSSPESQPGRRLPLAGCGGGGAVAPNSDGSSSSSHPRGQHGFRRAKLGPPFPAALARPSAGCIAPEVVRGQEFGQPADVYAFGCALRAACCGAKHAESFYATASGGGGGKGSGGGGGGRAAGGKQQELLLPVGHGPAFEPLREALAQLLDSMLEEDPSRRCTVLEALSSDYFRALPLRGPNPTYPPQWSPFPVRTRSFSSTAPGGQPHWVAVALSAGGLKGDRASALDRHWFDSTYAVEVPLLATAAVPGGACSEGGEGSRVEALLQCSLPGARLVRLVRLQDRARMLRFVCDRDAAISSAAAAAVAGTGTGTTTPGFPNTGGGGGGGRGGRVSVVRLFADPREVVAGDALTAISTSGSDPASTTRGRPGCWTVGGTAAVTMTAAEEDPRDNDDARARGAGGPVSKSGGDLCRLAASARFAAVALAQPQVERPDEGGRGGGKSMTLRTLAVVRAVVSGDPEAHPGWRREGTCSGSESGGEAGGSESGNGWLQSAAAAVGRDKMDPFLDMACMAKVDDLTRVAGIGLSSPPPSVADAGGSGNRTLEPAPGLSSPAVHSITHLEAVSGGGGGEEGGPRRDGGGGGGTAAVYTVRREACYPEYLATFAL